MVIGLLQGEEVCRSYLEISLRGNPNLKPNRPVGGVEIYCTVASGFSAASVSRRNRAARALVSSSAAKRL